MSYNQLRRGRHSESNREYFITTVTEKRRPIFLDLYQARSFITTLHNQQRDTSFELLAWVLMPDHFHALIRLGDEQPLSAIMNQLKGRSARNIHLQMNKKGRLWQPGYYDHALRHEEDRLALARYIVANPLRAGLVKRVGDYPHWDSIWL